jgi:protein-tyrosine-phosphatase
MNVIQRRTLLALTLFSALIPGLTLAAPKRPVVLFICDFGTAKSAIARELFRRRAHERGIDVTAFSRGLQVEDHISPPLKARLDADGIDTRRDGFAVLTPKDVRKADIVVSFAKLPKAYQSKKLQDWTALPSVNDAWPAARADLDHRIDALLGAIAERGDKR